MRESGSRRFSKSSNLVRLCLSNVLLIDVEFGYCLDQLKGDAMKVVSAWTEENVKLLKRWWESGMTAQRIAEEFQKLGFNITKNSVIGKVHRCQFRHDPEQGRKYRPKPTPRIKKQPTARFLVHGNVIAYGHKHVISNHKEPDMVKAPDPTKQVLLTETTEGDCRAIVGYRNNELGQAICCGEKTPWVLNERERKLARSPWCQHHREIYIKRDVR